MSRREEGHGRRYRCECRRKFQVFGFGRQRRFYELDGPGWTRPVMTHACPQCQRALPPVQLEEPST